MHISHVAICEGKGKLDWREEQGMSLANDPVKRRPRNFV